MFFFLVSDFTSMQDGGTALMIACGKGQFQILDSLLNAGAQPDLQRKVEISVV